MRGRKSLLARTLQALIAAALILSCPPPARAVDEILGEGFCREALARILCKPRAELNYVGRQAGSAFVFNVFYGAKDVNFVCTYYEDGSRGTLVATSSIWLRERRSLDYSIDPATMCAQARYFNPQCPSQGSPSYCRQPTAEEQAAAKVDAFWYKPVPPPILSPGELGGSLNATPGDVRVVAPDAKSLFPPPSPYGERPEAFNATAVKNATMANATAKQASAKKARKKAGEKKG